MYRKIVLCLVVCIGFLGIQAYAFSESECDIKNNIENLYGLKIVFTEDDKELNDCLQVLERSLKKFPHNIIKEITDFYFEKGIDTNIIIDKTENIKDLFSGYRIGDTGNIYIKVLDSSLHSGTCLITEESVLHEIGHFIGNYLLKKNDLSQLRIEFDKINQGYGYGTWSDDHYKIFINKHAANSFEDEISDLIWYAEAYPSELRNINGGDISAIHEKLKLLAQVLDENFDSISHDTKLWYDAIPQKPQDWAKEKIMEMKKASLIPEEFNGIYEAYITREDFYKLIINLLYNKVGKDNLINYFGVINFEEGCVALDPVNGKVFMDEDMHKPYPLEIFVVEDLSTHEGYMSRLEIAKILIYIGSKLGMNISEYDVKYYDDIDKVDETERPYIYLAASKGLLKGDGLSFKPYDYCTYQEVYIILMRFYNLI